MTRALAPCLRRATVPIVFLCVLALTLCQILGATARLNTSFSPADLAGQAFTVRTIQAAGAHIPLPSRCASIKLAPFEIKTLDLAPDGSAYAFVAVATSPPPLSTELGVPTPPPREA